MIRKLRVTHCGKPEKAGKYIVRVRYKGCNEAETEAVFSPNFGGIWGNMNIPSNDFDEIVWWHDPNDPNDIIEIDDEDYKYCLTCKYFKENSDYSWYCENSRHKFWEDT